MRRAAQAWIKCEDGDLVPAAVAWLIKRLSVLSDDPNQIKDAAFLIHGALLSLKYAAGTGHRLRGKRRLRAEVVPANVGPTAELERLHATACGGSEREFVKRWVASSAFVRQLVDPNEDRLTAVEKQRGPNGEPGWGRSFDCTGLTAITVGRLEVMVPTAAHALPKIEAALAMVRKMRPSELKGLKSQFINARITTSADLPAVVRQVYQALTGRAGISYDPETSGLRETALVQLCRDIDAEFGLNTFKPGRIKTPRV